MSWEKDFSCFIRFVYVNVSNTAVIVNHTAEYNGLALDDRHALLRRLDHRDLKIFLISACFFASKAKNVHFPAKLSFILKIAKINYKLFLKKRGKTNGNF